MKRVNGWLIDSFGSIRGDVVDSEGTRLTGIRTSRVVKRDGNIVTTHSGSRYELLEPSSVHMSRYILDMWFDGATDALAAIDHRIINHE